MERKREFEERGRGNLKNVLKDLVKDPPPTMTEITESMKVNMGADTDKKLRSIAGKIMRHDSPSSKPEIWLELEAVLHK